MDNKKKLKIVGLILGLVLVFCVTSLIVYIVATAIIDKSEDNEAHVEEVQAEDTSAYDQEIVYDDGMDYEEDEEDEASIMEYAINTTADNLAELYDSLGVENPIQAFCVYYTLLMDGDLSKTGNYRYTEGDFEEEEYYLAYSLIKNGEGVCRNTDDLFSMSLRSDGYDAYSVTCYNYDNPNEKIKNPSPSHQLTIVNDGVNVYCLDVTNNEMLDNYDLDEIYHDFAAYNYITPKYSLEEAGYLTTILTQEEYDIVCDWLDYDSESYDTSYFETEYSIAEDLLYSDYGEQCRDYFRQQMQDTVFDAID